MAKNKGVTAVESYNELLSAIPVTSGDCSALTDALSAAYQCVPADAIRLCSRRSYISHGLTADQATEAAYRASMASGAYISLLCYMRGMGSERPFLQEQIERVHACLSAWAPGKTGIPCCSQLCPVCRYRCIGTGLQYMLDRGATRFRYRTKSISLDTLEDVDGVLKAAEYEDDVGVLRVTDFVFDKRSVTVGMCSIGAGPIEPGYIEFNARTATALLNEATIKQTLYWMVAKNPKLAGDVLNQLWQVGSVFLRYQHWGKVPPMVKKYAYNNGAKKCQKRERLVEMG